MYFEPHVIILSLITVVCAERSIGLTKCYRNTNKNCEPFSFRRTSQNVTTASNQTIGVNHLEPDVVNSIDVIENRRVSDELTIQEEGNCVHRSLQSMAAPLKWDNKSVENCTRLKSGIELVKWNWPVFMRNLYATIFCIIHVISKCRSNDQPDWHILSFVAIELIWA